MNDAEKLRTIGNILIAAANDMDNDDMQGLSGSLELKWWEEGDMAKITISGSIEIITSIEGENSDE